MHFLFTFARTKVDRHVKIVIYNYHKDEDTGDRMHARKTSSQLYSLTQAFHVAFFYDVVVASLRDDVLDICVS